MPVPTNRHARPTDPPPDSSAGSGGRRNAPRRPRRQGQPPPAPAPVPTAAAVRVPSSRSTGAWPAFPRGRGHAGRRLTWAPPTVPCSRSRHTSPGKCGAERTGGCTGVTVDPVRGCSSPETLSSSSRRSRGPEPMADRPPAPPGTPAGEAADGPLRTAAAIFPGSRLVAWRDDVNTSRRTPAEEEGRCEEGAAALLRTAARRRAPRAGRVGACAWRRVRAGREPVLWSPGCVGQLWGAWCRQKAPKSE